MTAKLYIGGYDVLDPIFGADTGYDHTYLFYDPDGIIGNGNEKIIRGGPRENYQGGSKVTPYQNDPDVTSPNIIVELRDDARTSYDYRFPEETLADQDFRLLLSGAAATNVFNDMWAFALTLGDPMANQHGLYETDIDYDLVGPNSGSVVNSVMNAVGIDFRNNTPWNDDSTTVQNDPDEYPGHMGLLDGSGDNVFTAYIYDGSVTDFTKFHKRGGNDTIILEWNGPSLDDHGKVHVNNENDATGLTTIYMTDLWYGDVKFAIEGNDLTAKKGSTEIVWIEDFFVARANGLAEGAATTAFEFEDLIFRRGDNSSNVLDSSSATKDVLFHGFSGNDTLKGGAGFDIVDYQEIDADYSSNNVQSVDITVSDRASGNFEVALTFGGGIIETDTITGVERVAHAEWHANTTDTGVQRDNSIAGQKASGGFAGGYVVAWESQNTGGLDYQIRTQRFDESGNPAGSEFAPSLGATHPQFDPSVTSLANGGFVIAWQSKNSGADIKTFATIYNATGGVVAQDIEVFEDPDPPDYANYWSREYAKDLAEGHDGKIMVVAEGGGAQSTSTDIYGQLMSATGAVDPTQKVIVNDDVNGGGQTDPAIAAIPGGGYVVTYTNNHSSGDGSGNSVWYRKLDAAGTPVGSSVRVNTVGTYSHQKDSDVAVLESGEFVVVWTGKDSASDGVFMKHYKADGSERIGETRINEDQKNGQTEPQVTALEDGGYLIAFSSNTALDGYGNAVIGQQYDKYGTLIKDNFVINVTGDGQEKQGEVAALADGDFAVSWTGSGTDVYTRMYNNSAEIPTAPPPPPLMAGSPAPVYDAYESLSPDDAQSYRQNGIQETYVFSERLYGNGKAVKTLDTFEVTDGDRLDFSQVIEFDALSGVIGDYVGASESNGNTLISVDRDGAGEQYGMQHVAFLVNTPNINIEDLYNSGQIVV